jgi:hypothetical protein
LIGQTKQLQQPIKEDMKMEVVINSLNESWSFDTSENEENTSGDIEGISINEKGPYFLFQELTAIFKNDYSTIKNRILQEKKNFACCLLNLGELVLPWENKEVSLSA